jgi:hypothetical protein
MEVHHGVVLDGWHGVEMNQLLLYCRCYRARAEKSIDQTTERVVPRTLVVRFCKGPCRGGNALSIDTADAEALRRTAGCQQFLGVEK